MYMIANNLNTIKGKIAVSALKSGRKPEDITLVAVTKTRSVEEILSAISYGVTDIGENYVQECLDKYPVIGKQAVWHFIGHLQSNKVKQVIDFADLIHSVDSFKLAKEISRRADQAGKVVNILVEANLAEEESKFGSSLENLRNLVESISELPFIKVSGLMGMAPVVEDANQAREYFAKLKGIWDELPKEQRVYLSMGMTQDFEVAIEEGSNMVRIGTAIFGARQYAQSSVK